MLKPSSFNLIASLTILVSGVNFFILNLPSGGLPYFLIYSFTKTFLVVGANLKLFGFLKPNSFPICSMFKSVFLIKLSSFSKFSLVAGTNSFNFLIFNFLFNLVNKSLFSFL